MTNKSSQSEINEECPICMESIFDLTDEKVFQKPVVLDCNHVFHEKCILRWLSKPTRSDISASSNGSCPICRASIELCRSIPVRSSPVQSRRILANPPNCRMMYCTMQFLIFIEKCFPEYKTHCQKIRFNITQMYIAN